jgi:hypothetical protein
MVYKPPIVAITPSGEPMDPFTEQAQSDNYNNSPAIDMTRGGVFENGQEGIIAIDIQDGYDKFNDNVKNTFDSSQDLNITINEDVFTSNNESQAQAEGNGLFERFCSSTRPYRNRQKTGNSLMYRSSRCFRDVFSNS